MMGILKLKVQHKCIQLTLKNAEFEEATLIETQTSSVLEESRIHSRVIKENFE